MKNNLRLPLLLLTAAFAAVSMSAACSGSGHAPRIKSFSATPATVPSLGGDVLLVWDVRGADQLELTPDVGVVTGTSATVHVTSTTTFALIAKKSGRSAKKRATVTVAGPGAVVGTLRRALSHDPIANTMVWIKGHGATYTADDGTFVFDGVETPYDIAAIDPNDPMVVAYLGVTRLDPNLEIDQSFLVVNGASVSGAVTPAVPSGSNSFVIADTPSSLPSPSLASGASYGAFATWVGDPVSDAIFHDIRWTVDTAGNPAAYTGYGRAATTLTNGIAAIVPITVDPITVTDESTGTVNVPPTTFIDSMTGFLIFGEPTGTFVDEGFFLPEDTSAIDPVTGEFSLLSPALTGGLATAHLHVRTILQTDYGFARAYFTLAPGSTGNAITLPSPPRLLTPVDQGSVSRDSVLHAATRADSVKVFLLQTGPFTEFYVVTASDSFVIPDLREIGVDILQNAQISWSLYAEVAPRTSVDEAMGPDGVAGVSPEWFASATSHLLYSTEALP